MPGKFIVIDGTDGSGKTTQADLLMAKLKAEGHQVAMADFPQYNHKSAGLVEEYLSGKYGEADEVDPRVASTFYAVDRYDASFQIRRWLNEGKIVVCNRYVAASMGHQGAKFKTSEERKAYWEWLMNLEYNLYRIPQPDLNIILHVPSAVSQQLSKDRARQDWTGKTKDIHEDNLTHLEAAEKSYLELTQTYPDFILVECVKDGQIMPREEIAKLVWQEVQKVIKL